MGPWEVGTCHYLFFNLQDALGNMGVSGAPQVFGASAIVTWAKIRRCSGGFFGELESAVVGNELRVGLQNPKLLFWGEVSILKSSSTICFMKNVRFPLLLRPKMKECLLGKRMPINTHLTFLGGGSDAPEN